MNTCSEQNHITEFDISGLEAMLAGTLCLMSAYSHGHCGKPGSAAGSDANHQDLIGLKIVSNLTCLQYQNSLSPEFRRVLSKVCESWRQHSLLMHGCSSPDPAGSASHITHWHSAPRAVQ